MNLIDAVVRMNTNALYAWSLIGLVLLALFLIWVTSRLRYRITATHLEVTLFGICARRVAFGNIERVSKRPPTFSENWCNTLKPMTRRLVIHRKKGLFKEISITPMNRYLFKAELERAMQGDGSVPARPAEAPTMEEEEQEQA